MDPPFFVRLLYVAMTRFAYFLFFRAFFSVTYLGLFHFSDPVSPTYIQNCGFLHIVFSVPYILSGSRHFQRCFELNEYRLVGPIIGLLCYD